MSRYSSKLWIIFVCSVIVRYTFSLPIEPRLFLVRILLPLMVIRHIVGIINRIIMARGIYISLLIYLVYSVFTIAWIVNINTFAFGLAELLTYILIFILADINIKTIKDVKKTVNIIYYTFIASIGIGMFEILTLRHLPSSKYAVEYSWAIKGATSFFYNPNEFGIFIVLTLPIAYYFLISSKSKYGKIANGSVVIFSILVLGYTDSRLSLLTAVLQFIIYIIMYIKFSKKSYSTYIRSSLLIIGISVALTIVFANFQKFGLNDTSLYKKLYYLVDGIYDQSSSVSIRITILKTIFDITGGSALFGVGIGQLVEYIPRYNWVIQSVSAHSYLLKILSELGIVGFAAIILLIANIIRNLYRIPFYAIDRDYKVLSYS
ncbi:MAG: O-antigen ligase family protein, partial [Clostridiales bacterium]|nr:O-antigen ligase family protein [Clostridiales bacterium]